MREAAMGARRLPSGSASDDVTGVFEINKPHQHSVLVRVV
jgi:hypothetical protein